MAKSAIILAVFLFAGSAVINAAPADDSNINVKDFLITYFKHTFGLQACDPPCLNGGTCDENDECICLPGFEGEDCGTDPCSPANTNQWKCFNGGNCVPSPALPNGAECDCPDECPDCFTGDHCDFRNQCKIDAKYCSQHGICNNDDTDDGYTCYCQAGFTGVDCETKDICYPNPCQHGGICLNINGTVTCDCQDGFFGEFCQTADPCRIAPCFNGGTCTAEQDENGELVAKCECTPHYEGDRCELPIECNPKCVNGGLCGRDNTGQLICFCPPGYFGSRCENSVCSPSPCYNGGTCTIKGGQPECTCPEGYDGDFCEINPCSGVNCGHGNCIIDPNDGSTSCDCHDGWLLPDCLTPDDSTTLFPPTTKNPTTAGPTTTNPTTAAPTSGNPTTAAPTSGNPTTAAPTTAKPTTAAPTTANPTTNAPTTMAPTTATTKLP